MRIECFIVQFSHKGKIIQILPRPYSEEESAAICDTVRKLGGEAVATRIEIDCSKLAGSQVSPKTLFCEPVLPSV